MRDHISRPVFPVVPLGLLLVGAGCSPNPEAPTRDALDSVGVGATAARVPLLGPATVDADTDIARIVWTTDVPSSTRVEYGVTAEYGTSIEEHAPATLHIVNLTDLEDDTEYHFRFSSTNVDGYTAVSEDDTFQTDPYVSIGGTLRLWHPVEMTVRGPIANELDDAPNPFLDLRLVVRLTPPSGDERIVHGFFAGDGEGGPQGSVWRVRFAPDEEGPWAYTVFFRAGTDLAVDLDLAAGTPVVPHGEQGFFTVDPILPTDSGFYRWGLLEYVGGHHLKFRDGPFFLKGGTDSPENLLGYAGFDNTVDQPGGNGGDDLVDGLHRFPSHVADFGAGGLGQASDPLFVSADTGVDSRGIIGALNYLASERVNSIYFLPMNLGGDGRDTYPFVGAGNTSFDKTHYDVSKLDQWELLLAHATGLGIALQIVLAETETQNHNWLDNGELGVQRKLFYREMIARFGHHLAIKWNLAEENPYSVPHLRDFADFIAALDPYRHPIAFHTDVLPPGGEYADYQAVLGEARFSATSIQGDYDQVGGHVDYWRAESSDAGHPWVIDVDEAGPAGDGLTNTNAALRRRATLWDVYFNGGHIEWYAGSHDLPLGGDINMEDFRTREEMWRYTWYARKLLEGYAFEVMTPNDALFLGGTADLGGAEVLALEDEVYFVYLPSTDLLGTLDLSGTTGLFRARWYDPRVGSFAGAPLPHAGGLPLVLGPPPGGGGLGVDWVVVVDRP